MECPAPTEDTWQLRHFGAPSTTEESTSVIKLVPDGQVSVGRGPKADYFLDSLIYVRLISRIHAVITGEKLPNGHLRFTLTNKGLNGTYINDFKLGVSENNSQVLHEGDKVAFGHINCGSIKVGEYAPQAHSEFQFLFERINSAQEPQTCQTEVKESNPLFSPFPSDTPVYSHHTDISVVPDSYEEYNPPSPGTGNDAASEKENKVLKTGVHSFDSDDLTVEWKTQKSQLNPPAKFSKQSVKDNSEEDWKNGRSNQNPPSLPDSKIQKSTVPKDSLPDVIPKCVKDHHDDCCHHRVRRELKRSHSLPAQHLDEMSPCSHLITENIKLEQCNDNHGSSLSSSSENDDDLHKTNSVPHSKVAVFSNKPSLNSISHMSKKKRYILSMTNDDGLNLDSNIEHLDKGSEVRSYVEVKTSTALPQWDDLSRREIKIHHGDQNSPKFRNELKKEFIYEEIRSTKDDTSKGTKSLNVMPPKAVKQETDGNIGNQINYDQNLNHSKSKNDCKDKPKSSENYPPLNTVGESLDDVKDDSGKISNDAKVMSSRNMKCDDRVALSVSKERFQCSTTSSKNFLSSSPVVVMEKIPDNLEGKLWKHLKSKENFSTKFNVQSSSKSKSSKKHHHHSHHLHHRHHVDHNIQVKQKLLSSHIHNPIPLSHSSSSSKSCKSSRSGHMDTNSHYKHKKIKSHQPLPTCISSLPEKLPSTTTDHSDRGMPLGKSKAKMKVIDSTLHSEKTDNSLTITTCASISSFSSSANISESKTTHSLKSSIHSTGCNDPENSGTIEYTDSVISMPSTPSPKLIPSSDLPQLVKDTGMDVSPSKIKTRMPSTGFLSSDLNSDDEEVVSRENSPPSKKSDIVKRIYSPSRSPKQGGNKSCDTHNSRNIKKRKTASDNSSQEHDAISKSVSSCTDKSKDSSKDLEKQYADAVSHLPERNASSKSSECDKKPHKVCPVRRKHKSPVNATKKEPTSSKATIFSPTAAASSSLSPHSTSNTDSSSLKTVDSPSVKVDSLKSTHDVKLSKSTRDEKSSKSEQVEKSSNSAQDTKSSKSINVVKSSKSTCDGKCRSKHSQHPHLDTSQVHSNQNSRHVNENTKESVESKGNDSTFTSKSENQNCRKHSSTKRRIAESNDTKSLAKSKSSKPGPATVDIDSSILLTNKTLPSPWKAKEVKVSLNQPASQSTMPTSEHSSKQSMDVSSQQQPAPKNSKKQLQNIKGASSSKSSVSSSSTTSSLSSSGVSKQSSVKKNRKLKRSRPVGDDSHASASKNSKTSIPYLQMKRLRLGNLSESSSDSSSSSSSSSSPTSPSSVLFSANFPPNKSKIIGIDSTSKAKKGVSKSVSPSKDETQKSVSKSVSPSEDETQKSVSKSVSPSKAKTQKNVSKSVSPSKDETQKSVSKSVSPSKAKTQKNVSKSVSPSKDKTHIMPHTNDSKSSLTSENTNLLPRTCTLKLHNIGDSIKQPNLNDNNNVNKPSSNTHSPSKKIATTAGPKSTEKKHQELFSMALEASRSDRAKEKKVPKPLDKPQLSQLSKNGLKKEDAISKKRVVQRQASTPVKKTKDVDGSKLTRQSSKMPQQPPSTPPMETRRGRSPSPLKAGKKMTRVRKAKKKTSTLSLDCDEDDAVFDSMIEEEHVESDWDLEDGVEYCNEPCGAKKCSNPVGPKVDWVMCDGCEGWFHIVCVNTTLKEIADNGDQFQCGFC